MKTNHTLSALAVLFALGCQAEGVESSVAMATPADAQAAATALENLKATMLNIDVILNENEGAIVAATQQFPLGELELRDSGDLQDFQRLLDAFFGPLIQAVRDGQLAASAELRVPGELLCALDGRPATDPAFAQCVQAVSAVNVRAFLGTVEGGGFAIEFRHGGLEGSPVETPLSIVLDGQGLRAEIDLGQGIAAIDSLAEMVAGRLGLDLGVKVDDLARLRGHISASFSANANGITFLVDMTEGLEVRGPEGTGTYFTMQKATTGPFLSLQLRSDEAINIDVNIGHVSAAAPVGALGLDKQFTGVARLEWPGIAYHADGRNASALNFRADVGELRLDNVTPEATTTILGLKITSGTVRGTAEGFHRRPLHVLSGFQTYFANGVELVSTHLGQSSTRTIAAGSRIIDFRMNAIAKTEALVRLVAGNRELAKVNSLQCVRDGSMTVVVQGTTAQQAEQTLRVGDHQDDSCVVGYFTKDEAGTPHYNYGTQ